MLRELPWSDPPRSVAPPVVLVVKDAFDRAHVVEVHFPVKGVSGMLEDNPLVRFGGRRS